MFWNKSNGTNTIISGINLTGTITFGTGDSITIIDGNHDIEIVSSDAAENRSLDIGADSIVRAKPFNAKNVNVAGKAIITGVETTVIDILVITGSVTIDKSLAVTQLIVKSGGTITVGESIFVQTLTLEKGSTLSGFVKPTAQM